MGKKSWKKSSKDGNDKIRLKWTKNLQNEIKNDEEMWIMNVFDNEVLNKNLPRCSSCGNNGAFTKMFYVFVFH